LDPAPGASRTGGASTSTVAFAETTALVKDDGDGFRTNELANGHAKAATSANDPSFMVVANGYSGVCIERMWPDRSAILPNAKGLDRMMAMRLLIKEGSRRLT
jgi:hypothetical protein